MWILSVTWKLWSVLPGFLSAEYELMLGAERRSLKQANKVTDLFFANVQQNINHLFGH